MKELVRNVVIIVLLTTFIDLIMPSSSMQRFVKVVMGLFILVTLLNPILNLFTKGQDFEVMTWQLKTSTSTANTVLAQSDQLTATNQSLFLENYSRRIEGQMKALVKLVKGIKEVEVQVELKGGKQLGALEGIESVLVMVDTKASGEKSSSVKPVEPVRIGSKERTAGSEGAKDAQATVDEEHKRMEREIKNTLSNYFGINPKIIKVVFS
ncbi:stage III sporulation protein AF [Thermanaerosceptrum fracticalcis]|uniref:stage III sporulation protein AF n=1 Tax=Thermanaerosceptrum fracticalcis TaxID=1712410 RepID=UPI001377C138|nr:stage III sporulation protein AF [Thermanaerosceptrum fracticalcis]